MGAINIEVLGSFAPNQGKNFSAMESGHAAAVAAAIAWLSIEVLPRAIRQDHALQADGHGPRDNFGLPARS